MDQKSSTPHDIVSFQIVRKLTNLSTFFLTILEDLDAGIDIPYDRSRKKVLDALNDNKRELISLIDSFDITLKK